MALTVLKAYVGEAWLFVIENEKKAFHPSEKQLIKELSLKGLGANEEILRTAFGMVAAEIAKYDWPKDWPLLVDQLNEYMHSGQENLSVVQLSACRCFRIFWTQEHCQLLGTKYFRR